MGSSKVIVNIKIRSSAYDTKTEIWVRSLSSCREFSAKVSRREAKGRGLGLEISKKVLTTTLVISTCFNIQTIYQVGGLQ